MNGIDPPIISRAEELLELQAGSGDLVSACAQLDARGEQEKEDAVSWIHVAAPQEAHVLVGGSRSQISLYRF